MNQDKKAVIDDKEIDEIVAPIPEPKETKRFWYIIGSVVLAMLLICGSIVFYGYRSAENESTQSQTTKTIKGNKNSRIYHMPGCPNYDDIKDKNVIWFATEDEAKAAGFRKARNC